MMSLPVCRSRLSFSNQLRVVRHSVPRTCASLSRGLGHALGVIPVALPFGQSFTERGRDGPVGVNPKTSHG